MATTIVLYEGKTRILITQKAYDAAEKVEYRFRARAFIILRSIANGMQQDLDTKAYKHEGKFACGDRSGRLQAVYAIKAFQLRLYGGYIKMDGVNAFVVTEAVQKKKDEADRGQLERAAKTLNELGD